MYWRRIPCLLSIIRRNIEKELETDQLSDRPIMYVSIFFVNSHRHSLSNKFYNLLKTY